MTPEATPPGAADDQAAVHAAEQPAEAGPAPAEATAATTIGVSEIRRWRRYLADERAEAAVYRYLADRRSGEEREILLELAEAEGRHAAHWTRLLDAQSLGGGGGGGGGRAGADDVVRGSARTRFLALLARHFGSVFVLALAQRAEGRSPYATDEHATDTMAADERIHGEVVRALAARGRSRLSGSFRAAVFGANDGLVSNLALVLGIGAAGASTSVVLLTGLAGLLAGALSMGAGEYVSVRSQRELLDASRPDPHAAHILPHLDVNANELALVYRARGMTADEAAGYARAVLAGVQPWSDGAGVDADGAGGDHDVAAEQPPEHEALELQPPEHEALGTAWRAAISSFCFFASGAVIPVLPFIFGSAGIAGQVIAAVLVGGALLLTGAVVGLLSGGPPIKRAMRQLCIGYGAAAATYLLGLTFAS